jgi:GT2 family glycosyltransferase
MACAPTLVLTRYREPDTEVAALIDSLSAQEGVSPELLFYDQIPSGIIERKVRAFGGTYRAIEEAPLGQIRNEGISEAVADIVAFTDIDVVLSRQWLRALARGFRISASVGIVGGKTVPQFESNRSFLNSRRFIRALYQEFNPGDRMVEVEKVYGMNFAVHRKRLGKEAYIRGELGRAEGKLIGGEETELCQRCIAGGHKIVYNPDALLYHKIPAEKSTVSHALKAIFYMGFTRAIRGGKISVGGSGSLGSLDIALILLSIPFYGSGMLAGLRFKKGQGRRRGV